MNSNIENIIEKYNLRCKVIGETPLDIGVEKDSLYVEGYSGDDSKVIIPKFVTGIGNLAFIRNNKITNVVVNKELKYINNSAFRECEMLEDIDLRNNRVTIGDITWSIQ